MTDVEHETRDFLRELDSFGQPPPPQRLIPDNSASPLMSKEFARKLENINLGKQALSQYGVKLRLHDNDIDQSLCFVVLKVMTNIHS
uniref:Ras-associating domain-containing protein n=1 Tax=Ascaris lumbricoides TaxID=6252 RepID=A0A0M3HTH1_ASCLU